MFVYFFLGKEMLKKAAMWLPSSAANGSNNMQCFLQKSSNFVASVWHSHIFLSTKIIDLYSNYTIPDIHFKYILKFNS